MKLVSSFTGGRGPVAGNRLLSKDRLAFAHYHRYMFAFLYAVQYHRHSTTTRLSLRPAMAQQLAQLMSQLNPNLKTSNDTSEEVPTAPTLSDATADFAIQCDGRCFMAHKQILAKASPYFERMFRFNGLVGHASPYIFLCLLLTILYRKPTIKKFSSMILISS